MPDLCRSRMGWAFARLMKNLFTRLSTDSVDNLKQPSRHAG